MPRERATIYARVGAHYIFNYHALFSAGFYKTSKEGQRIDEVDFSVNLKINQNVTEFGSKNIDIKSELEQKNQSQETKIRGWIFDKIISKRTFFLKLVI